MGRRRKHTPLRVLLNNRLIQEAQRREGDASAGDSTVNYAPGSTSNTTTNAAPAGNRPGRGRFGESSSQVWIKE